MLSTHDRRNRLVLRHGLGAVAPRDPADVARDVVVLHGTDPASVYLSVLARTAAPDVAEVDRALYVDRTLVRMMGMRRTVFVVPVELAPVVQAAAATTVAARQRTLLHRHLAELAGNPDPGPWLTDVEEATLAALAARGEALAVELSADEPRLRTTLEVDTDKPYGGSQQISSRVLTLLGTDGRIVRGRPRGSWLSTQFRWTLPRTWLPGVDLVGADPVAAERALARRYLERFGPATPADLKWWAGWTNAQVTRAVAALGAVEIATEDGPAIVLPDDVDPVGEPAPSAALLPALDPTPMGWTARGFYLGPHRAALFDRSGNIGPTLWWDGRIVGGWGQRADGTIATRLLEDVGAEAAAALAARAATLAAAVGDVRWKPRFRTPLERELVA